MRILHVDLGHELRGGQHQVLLLLKTLRAAGHSVTLAAPKRSPLFESAVSLQIPVQPASLFNFRRSSGNYDLVHVHDAHAHSWAAVASPKPFVVSRRVAFDIKTSPFSKLKYKRAARYLAVSQFVVGKLLLAGIPESKIDIVYDAVEAAGQIQVWHADSPVVALALTDPLKGRDLIERAADLARIPITFSSDLPKDLSRASAFVYISRSEGFGSAALLAMTMGVPLIASAVDGMAEVFEDGISGIAVENNATVIAAAMTRLRTDPALARSLIANARERATKLFGTNALLVNTVASYRRALAR